MPDDPRETIRQLAALAGLPLTDERIAALALVVPFTQSGIATLAGVDYQEVEPAARFRPRPERH